MPNIHDNRKIVWKQIAMKYDYNTSEQCEYTNDSKKNLPQKRHFVKPIS